VRLHRRFLPDARNKHSSSLLTNLTTPRLSTMNSTACDQRPSSPTTCRLPSISHIKADYWPPFSYYLKPPASLIRQSDLASMLHTLFVNRAFLMHMFWCRCSRLRPTQQQPITRPLSQIQPNQMRRHSHICP
jgi:hypothetical protein